MLTQQELEAFTDRLISYWQKGHPLPYPMLRFVEMTNGESHLRGEHLMFAALLPTPEWKPWFIGTLFRMTWQKYGEAPCRELFNRIESDLRAEKNADEGMAKEWVVSRCNADIALMRQFWFPVQPVAAAADGAR